jgi:uncharacterized damage-inducible protein DinB
MIASTSLHLGLETVSEGLIQSLRQFSPESFIKKPGEHRWSAAEVAEHLLIIAKNINRVVQAESAVPDRASDKKVTVIKEALRDRGTKRIASEHVVPSGDRHDQQGLMNELQAQMQQLSATMKEKDLNGLCTVYPHPRLGKFTRLEWGYFIIYHTERHCHQLQDIYDEVKGNV